MTVERDMDPDATVKMPRPAPIEEVQSEDIEPFDPDQTIAREDWESTVIRRVAPRVAAVQSQVAQDSAGQEPFGWESVVLRRLSRELTRNGAES
jgi:hypothetical protein